MDAKVIPSETIASQHRLLTLDLRLNFSLRPHTRFTGPEKIKWWHLPVKRTQLAATLYTHIAAINDEMPVETLWANVTKMICDAAGECLGVTKPGRQFIDKQVWWWTNEVQKATKAKKAVFKRWHVSRAADDWQEYKRLKSIAKKAVATAKARHYADLYARLDTPKGANQIYKLANARLRSTLDIGQVMNIKDAEHRVLRDPPAILQRWKEYFDSTCNEEFLHPPITSAAPVSGPVLPISLAEVEFAIKKMKSGKAPGPDDIPVEAWKLLGHRGVEVLTRMFNKIIDKGATPSAWAASVTVPIWKGKGDVSECTTYRPIRLLCHAMKIFERVIDTRLRKIISISPNQCGFVRGRGTTDAIYAVRLLLERHREKNQPVHMAFLDLEKAFDRVP
ncbi:MAG: RNA-directed DNA polymerase, partial [Aeromonas sp.]